jgi:hypothetical protein
MDEDVEQMSREQLVAEVKRLRQGIRQHRDSKHGQDLLYLSGELSRLTCNGPCGRNSRRIRSVFGLLC